MVKELWLLCGINEPARADFAANLTSARPGVICSTDALFKELGGYTDISKGHVYAQALSNVLAQIKNDVPLIIVSGLFLSHEDRQPFLLAGELAGYTVFIKMFKSNLLRVLPKLESEMAKDQITQPGTYTWSFSQNKYTHAGTLPMHKYVNLK